MSNSSELSTALVSVIIPTYYRNDFLQRSIESVLAQTHEPVEILVVDDSGEAHAEPVVDDYPEVEYIPFDENRGAQAARTAGIERAHGKYVNLLDDDDRMKPRKFEKQLVITESNPDVGVVYCGKEWENGHKILPNPDIRGDILHHALRFRTTPSSPSAMLIERELLTDVLPLNDRPGGDDLGMKIELALRTEFDFVDESLLIQGAAGESRGGSMGAVIGRRQILDEYADLYADAPSSVYQHAVAHTYLLEANTLLDQSAWSLQAIKSSLAALYHIPGAPLSFVGYAVASLFGRPGRRFGWKLYDKFVLGDKHRGGLT